MVRDVGAPTIRQRFVARARYLSKHPAFRAAIVSARAAWDDVHPEFRVGDPGYPPDPPFSEDTVYVYPPPLATALGDAYEFARRKSANVQTDILSATVDPLTLNVAGEWIRRVDELCREWWPPNLFPNWLPAVEHPATRFVSARLVWKPTYRDEQWIASYRPGRISLSHDPLRWDQMPQVRLLKAIYDGIMRRIDEAVASGQPLSRDLLAEFKREAGDEANQAVGSTSSLVGERRWTYVYVFPEMTRADWTQLAGTALQAARRAEDGLRLHAFSMFDNGASNSEVAGELGLSRPKVADYRDGYKGKAPKRKRRSRDSRSSQPTA